MLLKGKGTTPASKNPADLVSSVVALTTAKYNASKNDGGTNFNSIGVYAELAKERRHQPVALKSIMFPLM